MGGGRLNVNVALVDVSKILFFRFLGPGSKSSSTSSLSSIASDVRCSVPTITSSISGGTQGRYYSDSEMVKTSQMNNKPTQNNQNNKSRNIILTGRLLNLF